MPTMRDVAHRANVSIATVSHVINKTRPVSSELRERVYAAMEALGYERNVVARALRSKQSLTIGVIVPDSTNPFFAEVMRGIEDVSLAREYSVILCDTRGDLATEELHTRNLVAKQVDGIIYIAAGKGYTHIEKLIARSLPVVLVERDPLEMAADAVLISNFDGGYAATSYLTGLGHRRVACITGPSRLTLRGDRLEGYRRAMEDAGLRVQEQMVQGGDFSCGSGYRAAKTLLALPQRPTAIFAFNDLMALGVLRAAHEAGLQVPDQLSVIGFDDIYLASFAMPALTTIRLPKHEMGRQAADMLLRRIDDGLHPSQRQQLPIELIVRRSTAASPSDLDLSR
jgi:LacI family transcriptional regulator